MKTENEILISVIVPVYNAEQFIDRAVQSVLCQMDDSIELILVNDGSADRSGAICDAYAAKNANITGMPNGIPKMCLNRKSAAWSFPVE